MLDFTAAVTEWFQEMVYEAWVWFTRLNQQEWMVLLAVVACVGFLCMRGLSSKGHV